MWQSHDSYAQQPGAPGPAFRVGSSLLGEGEPLKSYDVCVALPVVSSHIRLAPLCFSLGWPDFHKTPKPCRVAFLLLRAQLASLPVLRFVSRPRPEALRPDVGKPGLADSDA